MVLRLRAQPKQQPFYQLATAHLLRFCFASLLGQGSLFYELLVHCRQLIEKELVISYDPS